MIADRSQNIKPRTWNLKLFQSKQTFYKIHVGFVNGSVDAKPALTAFGFFGKNVAFERFLMCDRPRASYFKPFFGTGIRFDLWHFNYLFQ